MRDYSDSIGWDHTPPGPELPDDVVENTRAKYVEAYERITERKLAAGRVSGPKGRESLATRRRRRWMGPGASLVSCS